MVRFHLDFENKWLKLRARVAFAESSTSRLSFAKTRFICVFNIGAFGIQGLDDITEGLTMEGMNHQYDFKAGRIYNLESSGVINKKALVVGAHSDIAHPEVAHAWWQAVMVD